MHGGPPPNASLPSHQEEGHRYEHHIISTPNAHLLLRLVPTRTWWILKRRVCMAIRTPHPPPIPGFKQRPRIHRINNLPLDRHYRRAAKTRGLRAFNDGQHNFCGMATQNELQRGFWRRRPGPSNSKNSNRTNARQPTPRTRHQRILAVVSRQRQQRCRRPITRFRPLGL